MILMALEELSFTTILLSVIVLFVFLWMIKLAYDVKKLVYKSTHAVEQKTIHVESEMHNVKAEILHLNAKANEKADSSYIQKRIDGLISLAKK